MTMPSATDNLFPGVFGINAYQVAYTVPNLFLALGVELCEYVRCHLSSMYIPYEEPPCPKVIGKGGQATAIGSAHVP